MLYIYIYVQIHVHIIVSSQGLPESSIGFCFRDTQTPRSVAHVSSSTQLDKAVAKVPRALESGIYFYSLVQECILWITGIALCHACGLCVKTGARVGMFVSACVEHLRPEARQNKASTRATKFLLKRGTVGV